MGLRKPEAEAFAAIANDVGVPLERILFFDDTEQNVAGARAVGKEDQWARSHLAGQPSVDDPARSPLHTPSGRTVSVLIHRHVHPWCDA